MAKISKNIKNFRKERGLTQDELAKRINVTRQAISNWENDKALPDIEKLTALAEAMELHIEELIYGRRVREDGQPDRTADKNRIRIILSIVGSVFAGVGLVLIFFTAWNRLTMTIQAVIAFIPMLASQSFALYVFFKRPDRIWRESAATLWTIGVISTVALVNSVFSIHFGYENGLLIDTLLCIPVMLLMDAVAPLAVIYYMGLHWGLMSSHYLIGLSVLAVGTAFTVYKSRKADALSGKYTQWITAVAAAAYPVLISLSEASEYSAAVATAVFLCLFLLGKKNITYELPQQTLGIIGMCAALIAQSAYMLEHYRHADYYDMYPTADPSEESAAVIFAVLSAIAVAACTVIGRKSFAGSIAKFVISGTALSSIIAFYAASIIDSRWVWMLGALISTAACFAVGGTLIAAGVAQIRLAVINVGLITVFAQIMTIYRIFSDGQIMLGIMFLIFGAALIAINTAVVSRRRNMLAGILPEQDGGGEPNEK